MAITADAQQLTVPLEKIHVPDNVRSLDVEHVQALAGSIRLQGVLVPVVVTPAPADVAEGGWEFELAAGFHRVAAAAQLGLTEVPVVVRLGETVDSDRAIENIARKNLRADDEARAVKAMLDRGFSEDGAAQALGWPRQRVTARMKLLELPDRARELVGAGVIALSTVDELRTIGQISPPLLDVLIDYVDGAQDDWPARQLSSDPGRVLGEALRHTNRKVFAAYLNQIGSRELEQLRLGKTTTTLLAEAETLHKQLDRYAYGPPIRFAEQDIDEARAAGVLIELQRSQPIIVDRALYRELAKGAVKRTTEQLRAKAAAAKSEKRSIRAKTGEPADPIAEARREHGRQLRELADQAHGANLDLGGNLLTGLASVDPASMDVARLFTFGLLGGDYDGSPYSNSGDRVSELAMRGIRLVIDEFRTDVTKTRKDGSRGRLRIDYGDPRQPENAIKWLWKFLDGARSAGDLYGRAIVVLAAEQYACRLVLPSTQQHAAHRWPSHKDHARKALAKLAGPHLPATLKQLEKAIEKAHNAYEHAQPDASAEPAAAVEPEGQSDPESAEGYDDEHDPDDEPMADGVGGDLIDPGGAVGPDGQVYSDADPGL